MYIYYSIGNNSGPRTLVRIVEVSVIGGVRFRRFHCTPENLDRTWQDDLTKVAMYLRHPHNHFDVVLSTLQS